jgi:hypothetical protein
LRVEVLYVPACPSHAEAVKLVRDAMAAERVIAEVHEVLVTDDAMAGSLRFRGSPTIRINGRDVVEDGGNPAGFALSCRLYGGSKLTGVPPEETVRQAVVEALARGEP